jgi:hypothetical protein
MTWCWIHTHRQGWRGKVTSISESHIKQHYYRLHNYHLSIYGSTVLVDLGRLFNFLIYTQSVGLLGGGISPVARPLPTHRTTQTQNEHTHTQTSMSSVAFEPTIPVFERAKTVNVLDRAATMIGTQLKSATANYY